MPPESRPVRVAARVLVDHVDAGAAKAIRHALAAAGVRADAAASNAGHDRAGHRCHRLDQGLTLRRPGGIADSLRACADRVHDPAEHLLDLALVARLEQPAGELRLLLGADRDLALLLRRLTEEPADQLAEELVLALGRLDLLAATGEPAEERRQQADAGLDQRREERQELVLAAVLPLVRAPGAVLVIVVVLVVAPATPAPPPAPLVLALAPLALALAPFTLALAHSPSPWPHSPSPWPHSPSPWPHSPGP